MRPISEDTPLNSEVLPHMRHDSSRDTPASCPIFLDHFCCICVGGGEIVEPSDASLVRLSNLIRQSESDSSSSAIVPVGAGDITGHREREQIGGIVPARAERGRSFSLVTGLRFLCSWRRCDSVAGGEPSSCLRRYGTRDRIDEWVTDRVESVVSRRQKSPVHEPRS